MEDCGFSNVSVNNKTCIIINLIELGVLKQKGILSRCDCHFNRPKNVFKIMSHLVFFCCEIKNV